MVARCSAEPVVLWPELINSQRTEKRSNMSREPARSLVQTFETLTSAADVKRFDGIRREYSSADVIRLRGSLSIVHTLAEHAANKLWRLLHSEEFVAALGAV